MSILSGFLKTKRRRLTDEGYKLQSEWTSSQTVIMGDGTDDTNTLEKNLGAIQGISSSLTSTSENVALSCAAGNQLAQSISTYFGSYTIASGSTSYIIENESILTSSDITVNYPEDSEEIAENAKPHYARTNGALVITFENPLEYDVTIEYVKIKNPKVVSP